MSSIVKGLLGGVAGFFLGGPAGAVKGFTLGYGVGATQEMKQQAKNAANDQNAYNAAQLAATKGSIKRIPAQAADTKDPIEELSVQKKAFVGMTANFGGSLRTSAAGLLTKAPTIKKKLLGS